MWCQFVSMNPSLIPLTVMYIRQEGNTDLFSSIQYSMYKKKGKKKRKKISHHYWAVVIEIVEISLVVK